VVSHADLPPGPMAPGTLTRWEHLLRPEWRFLGLKRQLPSVRGLAAAGPAGEDLVSDVACTRAAHSGPAACLRGDWRLHAEQ
jgi:hypothetical protein